MSTPVRPTGNPETTLLDGAHDGAPRAEVRGATEAKVDSPVGEAGHAAGSGLEDAAEIGKDDPPPLARQPSAVSFDRETYEELITTIAGAPKDPIHSVCFTVDGSRIVSGSGDATVKLWDAESGQLLRTFGGGEGHSRPVTAVAMTEDGTRIASGGSDNVVKIWDFASGKLCHTLRGHTLGVTAVAFFAAGRRLVTGSWDKTVKVWDAESGASVLALGQPAAHAQRVSDVAITADETRILSASVDRSIKVWDAVSAELVRTIGGDGSAHIFTPLCIAVTPQGTVVSGTGSGNIMVWSIETGAAERTLYGDADDGGDAILCVAVTSNGSRVVSGSIGKKVAIWDAQTGDCLHTLAGAEGHAREVRSVAVSADGRCIASGSWDSSIKVWDAEAATLLRSLVTGHGHLGDVLSVALTGDGARIVSSSADAAIKIWDARSGEYIRTMDGEGKHTANVRSVVASADGATIVSGSYDHTIKIWDAETGVLRHTLIGHGASVNCLALTNDSKWIASGSLDESVKIWNAETYMLVHDLAGSEGHKGDIKDVAFSANGKRLVSASADASVKVWDPSCGRLMHTLKGHEHVVSSVALTADSRRIVSASHDGTIRVWSTETMKVERILGGPGGHLGLMTSVLATADGRRVVSASRDHTIKLWDILSGRLLRTLAGPEGHSHMVWSIAATEDGRCVVSGSSDMTIKIWDTTSVFYHRFNPNWGPSYALSLLQADLENEEAHATREAHVVVAFASGIFEQSRERPMIRHQAKEIVVQLLPSLLQLERKHVDSVVTHTVVQLILDDVLNKHRALAVVVVDALAIVLLIVGYMRTAWLAISGEDDLAATAAVWPLSLLFATASYFSVRDALQVYVLYTRGLLASYFTSFWNLNDFMAIVSASTMIILTLGKAGSSAPATTQIVAAFGTIPHWIKVLGFLRALSLKFATFVLSLLQIFADLRSFLFVLAVIILGSAAQFYLLLGPQSVSDAAPEFESIPETLLSTFRMMVGDTLERDVFAGGSGVWTSRAAVLLLVMYTFLVNVLLLNILIAVVSDSYEYALIRARKLFLRARLDLVAELDTLFRLGRIGRREREAWLSGPLVRKLRSNRGLLFTPLVPLLVPLFVLDVLTLALRAILHGADLSARTAALSIDAVEEEENEEWRGRALDMEKRVARKVDAAEGKIMNVLDSRAAAMDAKIAALHAKVCTIEDVDSKVTALVQKLNALLESDALS